MRKQICHTENRIAGILADVDLDRTAVCLDDHTMQRKRNCSPLVFLDTAVVMRFEQCHLAVLVKRILLQIQTGRVDMCCAEPHAICNRRSAYNGSDHCLATVILVDLIASFQRHAGLKRNEAVFFQFRNCKMNGFPLGFRHIQKCHIVRSKGIACLQLLRRNTLCSMLCLIKQCIFGLLCF